MVPNSDIIFSSLNDVGCRDCLEQSLKVLNEAQLVYSSEHIDLVEGDHLENEDYSISIHGFEKCLYLMKCINCDKLHLVLYEYSPDFPGLGLSVDETYTLLSDETASLIDKITGASDSDLLEKVMYNPTLNSYLEFCKWTRDKLLDFLFLNKQN